VIGLLHGDPQRTRGRKYHRSSSNTFDTAAELRKPASERAQEGFLAHSLVITVRRLGYRRMPTQASPVVWSMSTINRWLVRASDRIVPCSSDETLRLVKPASFYLARRSFDELGLAMVWGGGAIFGMVLMGVLTAAGRAISDSAGQASLLIGTGLTWFAIAGLCLHAGRYLIAEYGGRAVERDYVGRIGRTSSKDAALGQAVTPARPRLLLALTLSTDWDLLIQLGVGVCWAVLTR